MNKYVVLITSLLILIRLFDSNQLSGSIPPEIGTIESLEVL
jgi:hypothetical protein